MKKKVLMAILPVCVAMVITACGGNADTTEVAETAVTEENAENAVQTAERDSAVEEEAMESEEELIDENEDGEGEESADENVEGEEDVTESEFLKLSEEAIAQDKSAEYGVNSASSYDVEQFINEEGDVEWEDDFEAKAESEFSGRFAYPILVQGDAFFKATIVQRTDSSELIDVIDNDGHKLRIILSPGHSSYNWAIEKIKGNMSSNFHEYSQPFTVDTIDGQMDVLDEKFDYGVSPLDWWEEDESVSIGLADGSRPEPSWTDVRHNYSYKLGRFEVTISCQDIDELTQEQVLAMADSIILVGEPTE